MWQKEQTGKHVRLNRLEEAFIDICGDILDTTITQDMDETPYANGIDVVLGTIQEETDFNMFEDNSAVPDVDGVGITPQNWADVRPATVIGGTNDINGIHQPTDINADNGIMEMGGLTYRNVSGGMNQMAEAPDGIDFDSTTESDYGERPDTSVDIDGNGEAVSTGTPGN